MLKNLKNKVFKLSTKFNFRSCFRAKIEVTFAFAQSTPTFLFSNFLSKYDLSVPWVDARLQPAGDVSKKNFTTVFHTQIIMTVLLNFLLLLTKLNASYNSDIRDLFLKTNENEDLSYLLRVGTGKIELNSFSSTRVLKNVAWNMWKLFFVK